MTTVKSGNVKITIEGEEMDDMEEFQSSTCSPEIKL